MQPQFCPDPPNLNPLSLVGEALRLTRRSMPKWFVLFLVYLAVTWGLTYCVEFFYLPKPIYAGEAIGIVLMGTFHQILASQRANTRASLTGQIGTSLLKIPKLAISSLLTGVIGWGLSFPIIAGINFLGDDLTAWLLQIAWVALLMLAMVRLILLPSTCFLERGGPIHALNRTLELTKRRVPRLLLALVTATLASSLVTWVLGNLIGFLPLYLLGMRAYLLVTGMLAVAAVGFTCALPLTTMFVAYARLVDYEKALKDFS